MLNYCIVKQRIGAIAEDDPNDDDRYPDYRTVSGDVTFTPILPQGKAYQIVDSEGITYTAPALRITAKIVNGEITHEGEPGVHLFAAGVNSNPRTIAYNVIYSNLNAGGIPVTLSGISFVAIPGGVIDLATATPIIGTPGVGITKGDKGDKGDKGEKGDPFTYDDFTPKQLEDLSTGLIDELVETTINTVVVPALEGARDEALGQVAGAVDAEVAAISYRRGTITPGTDWNTVTDEGVWARSSTPPTADPNQPSGNLGTLIVGKADRAVGRLAMTQLFIGAQGDGMWYRARTYGGVWLAWKQVADYQNINPRLQTMEDNRTSDLERIKVAERTHKPLNFSTSTDLDNFTTPGRYYNVIASSTGNPALHYPPGAQHGVVDIIDLGGFITVQIYTEIFNDRGVAIRRHVSGSWMPWKWLGAENPSDVIDPLIARVAALESAAFDTQVVVAPGSRSLVGGARPRTWLTPGTDIYWTGATGQEFFPAGYTGEGQVGTMGKKTTYSDMSVTKISAGGLLDIVCSDPDTGECIIIRLDRTTAGQYRDDFEIIRTIHAGHIVGGVAQKDDELSPVSNMEIAFNIVVDGKGEFFPWHNTRAAVAATPSVITDGEGASLGLDALPVGGAIAGVNGIVLTQSCYGRHTYTSEKNWVRVDQVTTITPDGLIQSETVLTALDDAVLGISYGPMTPINRNHFTTMQVLGGAEYPVPQTPATVDTMTPIPEGMDATSVLFTGSNYFCAASILAPASTWAQDIPGVEGNEAMLLQDRADNPLVKLYPRVFSAQVDLSVGTQWRLGGQWRFGHLSR